MDLNVNVTVEIKYRFVWGIISLVGFVGSNLHSFTLSTCFISFQVSLLP